MSETAAESSGAKRAGYAAKSNDGELVVWAGGAIPRLAWDVVTEGIKADQTPSRLHTVVDAKSGAVITLVGRGRQGHRQLDVLGHRHPQHDPVRHVLAAQGHARQLHDRPQRVDQRTAAGTQFTDADNTWGNGSASDRQTAGVDAQYGAEKTFDYYKNVLGRNGIWNTGVGARSRVHYGSTYVNAFWDGTQMTYGDGSGNTHPLTSIDVAAHEMSHGVTENTAGLNYSGDAGGLNEATSDIFGTAVEWYANNAADPGDYLIGEEININGNGTPLRYMDKPSKDGARTDCWSTDTKTSTRTTPPVPLNHWFYMASEGSGAKTINGVSYNSPTCGGSTVTGVGRAKAEKIWYRTLSTKLTSSSNYAAARNGAIESAKELYGATSPSATRSRRVHRDRGPGRHRDLRRWHDAAAHRWQPADQPGLRVRCGRAGPAPRARSPTTPVARPHRQLEAVARWQRLDLDRDEPAEVAMPSTVPPRHCRSGCAPTLPRRGSTAYDTMRVQVVDGSTTTTLATYSNVGTNATYTQKSFNVTAYKGKTIVGEVPR